MLIIIAAALIALAERLSDFPARILLLQFLNLGVHLPECLIVFFAARPRVESGLEAESVEGLVISELPAVRRVVFLLGTAQTNPPLLAGSVDSFGPLGLQEFAKA